MNYDITFCSKKNCKNLECENNRRHINWNRVEWNRGWYVVSMAEFKKCKHWEEKDEN